MEIVTLYGFWDQILSGLWITILITFNTSVIVLFMGLLGAISLRNGNKIWSIFVTTYTSIARGVPELLVMLLIYFGSSIFLMSIASQFGYDEYIELSPYISGVLALSLSYTAYAIEIFRGCLNNISHSQIEASNSLGLSKFQCYRLVILPQIWRLALPGLGNLFLILLKDSSLVSVIGLNDLLRASYVGAGVNKAPFTFYMVAAFLYLVITFFSTAIFRRMEVAANKGYS